MHRMAHCQVSAGQDTHLMDGIRRQVVEVLFQLQQKWAQVRQQFMHIGQ